MNLSSSILLLLICFISCSQPNKDKITADSKPVKVVEQEVLKEEVKFADTDGEIARESPARYINNLNKFYNHEDYYIPLYYIGDYSEEIHKMLIESSSHVVFEDSETRRLRLDPQIVKKYLSVAQLEDLVVFDSNQDIVDTISFKDYEFFDDMIETSFVATYQASLPEGEHIAVSAAGLDSSDLRKSPEIKADSAYLDVLVSRNAFPLKDVHSYGYFVHGLDTLSYLSTVDYEKVRSQVYLLKNGQVMDSINEDYIITGMTPVPLATKKEILYVSAAMVPETDIQWTILTGIDLSSYRFIIYERNRKN